MPVIRSIIRACGSALPAQVVTNADLERKVHTSDEWVVQRTGIRERRIAQPGETTSDLAIAACRDALERAGVDASEVDGIIVATTTPDKTFPSVACIVQGALGTKTGPAFDLQAACAGFIYALAVGDSLIRTGVVNRLLIVGAETYSSIVDWTDRTTCVLFGDGAGAVLLERGEGTGGREDRGIHSVHLHAEGALAGILATTGGVSTTRDAGVIKMNGREVYRHAVTRMSDVVDEALRAEGYAPSEIDWLVPHQANIRIIEGTAEKLGMSMEKVIVTVDRHGNTSAASIPLALAEGVNDGRIQPGQLLLLEGLGAGLTWGATLVRL